MGKGEEGNIRGKGETGQKGEKGEKRERGEKLKTGGSGREKMTVCRSGRWENKGNCDTVGTEIEGGKRETREKGKRGKPREKGKRRKKEKEEGGKGRKER